MAADLWQPMLRSEESRGRGPWAATSRQLCRPSGNSARPHRSGSWPRRSGAAHRASTPGLRCTNPSGGSGFGGPQAEVGGAGSVDARATTAEPRHVDLTVDLRARASSTGQSSGVVHFPRQASRSRYFRGHQADLGASQRRPPSHHARFGAHCGFCNVRSARPVAEGSCRRKELPGPPFLKNWWASSRVHSTTLKPLGTAPAQRASLLQRLSRVTVPSLVSRCRGRFSPTSCRRTLSPCVEVDVLEQVGHRLSGTGLALVDHSGTHVQDVGTDLQTVSVGVHPSLEVVFRALPSVAWFRPSSTSSSSVARSMWTTHEEKVTHIYRSAA